MLDLQDIKQIATLINNSEKRLEEKLEERLGRRITESEQRLEKRIEEKIGESEQRLKKEIGFSERRVRQEIGERVTESEQKIIKEVGDFISDSILPQFDAKADKDELVRVDKKSDYINDRINNIENLPTVALELKRKKRI